jgi:uncharacterized protein
MPRRGHAALALVLLAGASFAPAEGVTPALTRTTKYLDDRAGIFEESRGRGLNEKLAAFERATSDQIVVVVERRLPEEISIEELANRTFRDWKIGQKGGSNGVLFLVFIDDRRMRIEVGYGLEGAIPDARAHRITDEIVKPHFRKADYAGGIEAGVDAILGAARGESFHGSGRTAAESKRWWNWLASLPDDPNRLLVLLLVALLLPAVLVLVLWKRKARPGRAAARTSGGASPRFTSDSPSSSSSSPSSWSSSPDESSSDSSSSSSSDFSGGGGDSGGGGSSDSW